MSTQYKQGISREGMEKEKIQYDLQGRRRS